MYIARDRVKHRADFRLLPSQWKMSLQSYTDSHWLVAHLESALKQFRPLCQVCKNSLTIGTGNDLVLLDPQWITHFVSGCSAVLWARWRLKTPTSRLFTQPVTQVQIKEKHQSSASLAFVRGIHRWPVNSSHKWPVTRKMFPFDDIIMACWLVGAWEAWVRILVSSEEDNLFPLDSKSLHCVSFDAIMKL